MNWQTLYWDPPWKFAQRNKGSKKPDKKGPKFGGGASAEYPLMDDEDLLALAPYIDALTAKNSSMHMWASCARLDFAIELMKACGFRYATVEYVWIKLNSRWEEAIAKLPLGEAMLRIIFKGTGSYTQSNAELLLLGVKGQIPQYKDGIPKPAQVVLAPHPRYPKDYPGIGHDGKPLAGKIIHSRKPAIFRDLIASTRPDTYRVELFCREPAPGWHVLGNDVNNGVDIKEALSWQLII